MLYGAHISISKGIVKAMETIKKNGGNFIQIFLSNPRSGRSKKRTEKEIKEIIEYKKKNKICIVVHAPYVINLAKPFKEDNWFLKTLINEITFENKIGCLGSVVHTGKSLKLTKKEAWSNMKKNISYVLKKIPKGAYLILETSTGQGSETLWDLEEFAKFYNSFTNKQKEKFKICIDTCHIFVAGYDMRTKAKVNKYFKTFDKLIGLKYVVLIHLNDSKKELESHVDRHDNIGHGFIGETGLKQVIKIAKKNKIGLILETPNKDLLKEEIEFIHKHL